jgi:hypothetical protein
MKRDVGREDEAVQRVALKMGLGFADVEGGEEGKLRMSARMAIESLKGLFITCGSLSVAIVFGAQAFVRSGIGESRFCSTVIQLMWWFQVD